MTDFYEEYKPFRNYLRSFSLLPSLVDVWRYSLHLMERQPLPPDYAVGKARFTPINEHVYPWDLDILARDLVLNAGKGDRSLRNWRDLAKAINHIRQLEGEAYICADNGERPEVLLELHRLVHRQFPWHTPIGVNPMMRVLKVFGDAAVDEIVFRELGMTTLQFLKLGLAVTGHFFKDWDMSTNQYYGVLGISREASDAFFSRITCTMEELKAKTVECQSYGCDWIYTWNPLEATPLIRFNPALPDRVICPIPRYLNHRGSDGIFYDLVRSTGFSNPFGDSFQAYIGEVLNITCLPPRFRVLEEKPYPTAKGTMHGVDWILSDSTGNLFIECKTKRLRVNAKILSGVATLEEDLIVMAKAIAQHYANVRRALDGETNWIPNQLPVYLLVLTLEDWIFFSPRVREMLRNHVCRLLAEQNLSEQFLDEMPYTIASASDLEIVCQVIAQVGISAVMAKKTTPEEQPLLLLPFLKNNFKEELRRVNWRLFEDDWKKLSTTPEAGTT